MFPGRCYGTTLQYKKIIRAKITPLPPDTMLVITQPPAVITPSYQQCNGGEGGILKILKSLLIKFQDCKCKINPKLCCCSLNTPFEKNYAFH